MTSNTVSLSYNQLLDFYNIAVAQTTPDIPDIRAALAPGSQAAVVQYNNNDYRVGPFINGIIGQYSDIFPTTGNSPYAISPQCCALTFTSAAQDRLRLYALGELLDSSGAPSGAYEVIRIGDSGDQLLLMTEALLKASGVAKDQYNTVLGVPYGTVSGRTKFLQYIGNKPHFLFYLTPTRELCLSYTKVDGTVDWMTLNQSSSVLPPAWYEAAITAEIGVSEDIDMNTAVAINLPDPAHEPSIGDIVVNGKGGMGVLTAAVTGQLGVFTCLPVVTDYDYPAATWNTTEELVIPIGGVTDIVSSTGVFTLLVTKRARTAPQVGDTILDPHGTYGTVTAIATVGATTTVSVATVVSPKNTAKRVFSSIWNLSATLYDSLDIDDTAGGSFTYRVGFGFTSNIQPRISDIIIDPKGRMGVVTHKNGKIYTIITIAITLGQDSGIPAYPSPLPTVDGTYILAVDFDASTGTFGNRYWERVQP